jgi:hypothetical protein
MYDSIKRRQLDLLWTAYQLSDDKPALVLNGPVARATGFVDVFGEAEYMRVLDMDTKDLIKDGALVEAPEHSAADLLDITPYWLTDEGRSLLRDAGYPIQPNP